ncbi:MAG: Do family serine endopeptidase [Verrucomicrobiota bacterium]
MIKKKYTLLALLCCASLVILINQGVALSWPFGKKDEEQKATAEIIINEEPLKRDTKLTTSFSSVVKKISPSVVSIYTTKIVNVQQHPFRNDPFFHYFFGIPPRQAPGGDPDSEQGGRRQPAGLGSGVIVSSDGYILTNHHVVAEADEIKVHLQDGTERELDATLVGSDPHTDIAVLKLDSDELPTSILGNSDHVEVGDIVLAIGNPFDVGQTVTMGIVSAKGKKQALGGDITYQDFIQTDASINPGNSGGALVDAQGRVVGINTAIFSRSGGNLGIGFAVPINMARNVMEQLIQTGRISRGYLGIGMDLKPLSADDPRAEAFGLKGKRGIIITEVVADSPAEEAGIKNGDVLFEYNGDAIKTNQELQILVGNTQPGTEITVKVYRDGKPIELQVTLAENEERSTPANNDTEEEKEENVRTGVLLDGVEIQNLNPELRSQLQIPEATEGVLVTRVEPSSAAYQAELRRGNIISEVSRQEVTSVSEARKALKNSNEKNVLLRILSAGRDQWVARYISVARN